jgi:hypothetical protein
MLIVANEQRHLAGVVSLEEWRNTARKHSCGVSPSCNDADQTVCAGSYQH